MKNDALDRLRREIKNNVAYRYKDFLCVRKERKRKFSEELTEKGMEKGVFFLNNLFFEKYFSVSNN